MKLTVKVSNKDYEVSYVHSTNNGEDVFTITLISEELIKIFPLDTIVAWKVKGVYSFIPSNISTNDILMKIVEQVESYHHSN